MASTRPLCLSMKARSSFRSTLSLCCPFSHPRKLTTWRPSSIHYLFSSTAHSYSQSGGKSFATPQILENVRIPRFALDNPAHRQLSALSRNTAHELAAAARGGDAAAQAELRQVEAEVDVTAASLWGLSDDKLAEIKRSFEELG